jgi:hypothetical protein
MLKDAICVSGGENVDTSAELLTRAIEGKSVDDLQDSVRHNKNTLLVTFGCSRFTIKNFGHKLFSFIIIQALYPSVLFPFFLPFTAWVLWRTNGPILC